MTNMDRTTLERAIQFYEGCPDGQYDGEAWRVLRELLAALTDGTGEIRINGTRVVMTRVD